ncbi:hypothetical protein PAXINDRAFT_19610 [Paxillus involutus ATCC 200175]|uniref:Uncharacterized protein n=1 Tax=Paxillus involutus ATCC 200175 TaxID=664439 RepID=A0A0C9T7Q4_PAXIN|nr:hypothetical protein PAXINDRAFT_19610 [Paxillus involutus ATCC 200175]
MVTQNFVGDKPVDSFPTEAIQRIPDDVLTKRELERLSKGDAKEPGANRRAGVATRDPAQFDTKSRGGQGDHLPTTREYS